MRITVRSLTEIDKGKTLGAMCYEEGNAILGLKTNEGKDLLSLARLEGFKGKVKQVAVIHPSIAGFPRRVITAGLGKKNEASVSDFMKAAAALVNSARHMRLTSISVLLPLKNEVSSHVIDIAAALAEALILSNYRFVKYRTGNDDPEQELEEMDLIVQDKNQIKQFNPSIERAAVVAEGVCYIRDLVNEPPTEKYPKALAEYAKKLAKQGVLTVKIFEKKELEKMGMGALLGVARGSHQPPVFMHLTYKPKKATKKKMVFVGKGITFDSGGLNLKPPSARMETMKLDMAGAATVLGIFKLLPVISPPFEVHGLIPATENLPGGGAMKPSDVVKAYNGKTIEVINTDAEGRLILADALAYGVTLKPDIMIDIATLTGAVVVAIGNLITGMMGTAQKAMDQIQSIGEHAGELFLQFPLFKEYDSQMKSTVADVKNIGTSGKGAGTIIGGLFLKKFVGEVPWIHLDIAGTAWTDEELPFCRQGGTGVPLRTIIRWISSLR